MNSLRSNRAQTYVEKGSPPETPHFQAATVLCGKVLLHNSHCLQPLSDLWAQGACASLLLVRGLAWKQGTDETSYLQDG